MKKKFNIKSGSEVTFAREVVLTEAQKELPLA